MGAYVHSDRNAGGEVNDRIRRIRHTAKVVTTTGKYLFAVRAALPWYVRCLVMLTVAVKVVTAPLPVDGGVDELLMALTGAILWFRHRMLVRACWRAAQLETQ
jgi:hypothetical protein